MRGVWAKELVFVAFCLLERSVGDESKPDVVNTSSIDRATAPVSGVTISRRFSELLQHFDSEASAHCELPIYPSVEEGILAVHASSSPKPFVVRVGKLSDVGEDSQPLTVQEVLKKYGRNDEYYKEVLRKHLRKHGWKGDYEGQEGSYELQRVWESLCTDNETTSVPCFQQGQSLAGVDLRRSERGSNKEIPDDIEVEEHIGTDLNGLRSRFDFVFNSTNVRCPQTGKQVVSARDVSRLAVILGKRGSGVVDDDHYTVHFLHLQGRKLWFFHDQKWSEIARSAEETLSQDQVLRLPKQARRMPCDMPLDWFLGQRTAQQKLFVSCLLGPGDYLYAPEGILHSTCHLDLESATLIQARYEDGSTSDGISRDRYEL